MLKAERVIVINVHYLHCLHKSAKLNQSDSLLRGFSLLATASTTGQNLRTQSLVFMPFLSHFEKRFILMIPAS